jgi:hypothetical protein
MPEYRYDPDPILERLYTDDEVVRFAQRSLRGVDRDGIRALEGDRQTIWDHIRRRKAKLGRW